MKDERIEKIRSIGSLKEWLPYLNDETCLKLYEVLNKVQKDRTSYKIYPTNEEIFSIYRKLKPNDINVVIIAQDPYHDGNANGVAMSCKLFETPTIKQIKKALKVDNDFDITLEHWVKQGVFLVNTVLTVRKGWAFSHNKLGWQNFVIDTLRIIERQDRPIYWLLWGRESQLLSSGIKNEKHEVFNASHPASATYRNIDWTCNHFDKVNKRLKRNNLKQIKWKNLE